MAELAGLTHEAAGEHSAIIDMRATRNDKIVAYNVVADMDRCILVAVDAAVAEATCAIDVAIVAYAYVFKSATIDDCHIVAYCTHVRGVFLGVVVGNLLDTLDKRRAVTI